MQRLRQPGDVDRLTAAELETVAHAASGFAGARERYLRAAEHGLSDDDLSVLVARELGCSGGSGGPGMISEEHDGRVETPFVRVYTPEGSCGEHEMVQVEGKALLAAVRKAFHVPDTNGVVGIRQQGLAQEGKGAGWMLRDGQMLAIMVAGPLDDIEMAVEKGRRIEVEREQRSSGGGYDDAG